MLLLKVNGEQANVKQMMQQFCPEIDSYCFSISSKITPTIWNWTYLCASKMVTGPESL